jgi:CRP-like cAMP-binding protein
MTLKFVDHIANLPMFQHRKPDEFTNLLTGAEERFLKHREVLFRAGEPATYVAVVVQGAFKLLRSSPAGHDVIVFFATPGDMIGALLMPNPGSVYPVTTVAMGPAVVVKVPRETFLRFWTTDQRIHQSMSSMLFQRMSLLHDQKVLAKAPLAQRIACEILSLIERYCGEKESILPIPLTRQDIANAVGASVESVIRVMSDWSHQGIIETSDQLINVLKMDKLLEVIKGSQNS